MYKKTQLSNGLRVVTHDMKDRDSISIGFWFGVGGRYEEKRIKGAAHFLEHIVFKGSQKYSCEEIKRRIEGVGGTLNAFTAEEQTCFYAKIPSRHLTRTFDVLADMVFYPQISHKDVEKEKGVIVEEIKMYHDLPQYYVMELLDGLLWPGHPLGQKITGTQESVTGMSNRDLKRFHKDYYSPANAVISACGRLKHEQVVALGQKKLGKIIQRGQWDFDPVSTEPSLKAQAEFSQRDIEQMHLALGVLGYDEKNNDKYALNLLSVILGGNMSSRLFVEVREKRGLAYSIASAAKAMHDTGVFMIRAGVDNQKIVEAVDVILKELKRIKREGVTQDEFTRGKDYLLGQMLLGLEDTMDHMLWIGESVTARNKTKTAAQIIKIFEKIQKKDIKRVAQEILDEKHFCLALVGPITETQKRQISAMV